MNKYLLLMDDPSVPDLVIEADCRRWDRFNETTMIMSFFVGESEVATFVLGRGGLKGIVKLGQVVIRPFKKADLDLVKETCQAPTPEV